MGATLFSGEGTDVMEMDRIWKSNVVGVCNFHQYIDGKKILHISGVFGLVVAP